MLPLTSLLLSFLFTPSVFAQTCTPGWVCTNSSTRAYRQSNCTTVSPFTCANGCSNGVCTTPTGSNPELYGFVYRQGNQLMLDGKPYKFIGYNRDGAPSVNNAYSCDDGGVYPDLYLDSLFNHLQNTCETKNTNTVVRIWAYQWYARQYPSGAFDPNFTQIDRVIQKAKKYGVRLVVTLENHWSDCTKPTTDSACPTDNYPNRRKNTWYREGYKTWKAGVSPNYGYDYPLTYRDYVTAIVSKYKNEPIILMWQLMNEAESEQVVSCTDKRGDFQSLYNFTADMSGLIKSIDPNHLVSLGTIGNGNPGTAGSNYASLHALNTIDVLEHHDYGPPVSSNPSYHRSYIDTTLAAAEQLHKPIFMGESGIQASTNASTIAIRANHFNQKIPPYFNRGGDGYLIWSYTEGSLNDPNFSRSQYDVDYTDPTCTQVTKSFEYLTPCDVTQNCTNPLLPEDRDGDRDIDFNDVRLFLSSYSLSGWRSLFSLYGNRY